MHAACACQSTTHKYFCYSPLNLRPNAAQRPLPHAVCALRLGQELHSKLAATLCAHAVGCLQHARATSRLVVPHSLGCQRRNLLAHPQEGRQLVDGLILAAAAAIAHGCYWAGGWQVVTRAAPRGLLAG